MAAKSSRPRARACRTSLGLSRLIWIWAGVVAPTRRCEEDIRASLHAPPIFPVSSRQQGRRAIHKRTATCLSVFTNECARARLCDAVVRCGDELKGTKPIDCSAAVSRCLVPASGRSPETNRTGGEQTTMSKQKGRRNKPAPFLNSCSAIRRLTRTPSTERRK